MIGILTTLLAGLAGVVLALIFHIPGGAFTGAMVAAATVRLLFGGVKEPPGRLQSFARIVLGLTIGISVNRATLDAISASSLPVMLMVGALIVLSFLTAWILSRTSGLPFVTALCGAAPGAASAMVILAGDLEGDRPLVAVLHILRISSIVALVPLIMTAFLAPSGDIPSALQAVRTAAPPASTARFLKMAFLVLAGVPTAVLFRRWKVPAAEILAGILLSATANPLVLHLEGLPPLWMTFSQWIIGSGIGAQITRDSLTSIKAYTWVGIVMTLVLMGIGFLLGWILYLTTSMDLLTALIGSCPGGLEAMIILAGEVGANAQLVAAMHTARLVIVMVTLPLLVRRAINDPRGRIG